MELLLANHPDTLSNVAGMNKGMMSPKLGKMYLGGANEVADKAFEDSNEEDQDI